MESRSNAELRLEENISTLSRPLISPHAHSKRVLVVGGGIMGLMTSWILLDRGHHVTIISEEFISFGASGRLTSQIAAALWEFPPGGCGPQPTLDALEKSRRWALESYKVFSDIAANRTLAAEMGIKMRSLTMLFPDRVEADKGWAEKMMEIQKRGVHGFRRSASEVKKLNIDPAFGIADSYEHDIPLIDGDRALQWLMDKVQSKGAILIKTAVKGSLLDQEAALLKMYAADAIINATGLGAQKLALDDAVFPVRGGVFRVLNDGLAFPKIDSAAVMNSKTDPKTENYLDLVLMVPRNEEILILGSIVQAHEYQLDLNMDTPAVQELWKRLCRFIPAFKNARLDPKYPFAQGLRPFRRGGPRVERESGTSRIVHAYGHGGAGWSMVFGSAAECVALIEDVLKETPKARL